MERTERQTRDKYMETRSKLAQVEAEAKNLHATVNQLEIQLTHSQKVCLEMSLCFTSYKKLKESHSKAMNLHEKKCLPF